VICKEVFRVYLPDYHRFSLAFAFDEPHIIHWYVSCRKNSSKTTGFCCFSFFSSLFSVQAHLFSSLFTTWFPIRPKINSLSRWQLRSSNLADETYPQKQTVLIGLAHPTEFVLFGSESAFRCVSLLALRPTSRVWLSPVSLLPSYLLLSVLAICASFLLTLYLASLCVCLFPSFFRSCGFEPISSCEVTNGFRSCFVTFL
jgi:hypothetical protein